MSLKSVRYGVKMTGHAMALLSPKGSGGEHFTAPIITAPSPGAVSIRTRRSRSNGRADLSPRGEESIPLKRSIKCANKPGKFK